METKQRCLRAGGTITLVNGYCSNTDCLAPDCWFGVNYQAARLSAESGCLVFCPDGFESAEAHLDETLACVRADCCRNCPCHPIGSAPTAPGIVSQS